MKALLKHPRSTCAQLVMLVTISTALVGALAGPAMSLAGNARARGGGGAHRFSCPDATGARWHLANYSYKHDANGHLVYVPVHGNRYHVLASNASFCRLAHKWLRRLTSATPQGGFGGHTIGRLHIPPAYDLILKDDSPPGYVCIATIDDPRPGHHRDNPHLGFCLNPHGRGVPFMWTSVLPPETAP